MGGDVQEFNEGTHSDHILYINAVIEYIPLSPALCFLRTSGHAREYCRM
jgi:hypothetical protein